MIAFAEQTWARLVEARRQQYIADFLPVMRREFPEFWVRCGEEQIKKILSDQCDYAKTLGIDSARGIYLIFSLRARLGSDFPREEPHAWAREILSREGVCEAQRLDILEAQVWGDAS